MRRSPSSPTVRAVAVALVLAAGTTPLLGACGADDPGGAAETAAAPDRPADVEGTVDRAEDQPRLVGASDPYYEGMSLLSESTAVLGADGTPVDDDVLTDGDTVEVWADVCAESYPVQCQVVAVRVVG